MKLGRCKYCDAIIALVDISEGEHIEIELANLTGGTDFVLPITTIHAGCQSRPAEEIKACEHLWVRRRDGSWCANCGKPRFGVELSEEERERLRIIKALFP